MTTTKMDRTKGWGSSEMVDNRERLSLRPLSEQVAMLETQLAAFEKRESWLIQAASGELRGDQYERIKKLAYQVIPDPTVPST